MGIIPIQFCKNGGSVTGFDIRMFAVLHFFFPLHGFFDRNFLGKEPYLKVLLSSQHSFRLTISKRMTVNIKSLTWPLLEL